MSIADNIVTEARTWRNTPFLHQGRLKGLGVDCAGFIALVAQNVGITVEIPSDYRPQEDGTAMMRMLSQHLDFVGPTGEMKPGDVLALCDEALRNPEIPRHLVFVAEVSPKIKIIHSSRSGVVEHGINSAWRARIHSCWRLK